MKLKFYLFCFIYFNLLCINAFSQSAWESLAPLQNPPSVATMATVNGKIYILSGSGSGLGAQTYTNEYDPATNTWTKKSKIPQACYWATANGVNGQIYVMGGGHPFPGKKYNFIYNPAADSWSSGDSLLTDRMYHSSAELNGKIYLIGGQNGNPVEYYFDEYDTEKNKWERKANNLHNMAWYCSLVSLGDKIYRIGGGGVPNNVKTYFDSFNPVNNTWSALPDMMSRFHASVGLTYDNRIYLIGGNSNGQDIDSIYIYYPEIQEWVPALFKLPQPRVYHRGVICNDCMYIFGGQNTQSDPISGSLIRYCFKSADVKDLKINSIRTFPNPCHGSFYIENTAGIDDILDLQVYNLIGCKVRANIKNVNETQSFIEIEDIEKGIYFIRMTLKNETRNFKVIVEQE